MYMLDFLEGLIVYICTYESLKLISYLERTSFLNALIVCIVKRNDWCYVNININERGGGGGGGRFLTFFLIQNIFFFILEGWSEVDEGKYNYRI